MMQRITTVSVGWLIAFSVIMFLPANVFNVIVSVVVILCFKEFLDMYNIHENATFYGLCLFVFVIGCLVVLFAPSRIETVAFVIVPILLMLLGLIMLHDSRSGIDIVFKVIFGGIYVSFLLYFIPLRLMVDGRSLILVLCLGTWGRDLGAFLFGRIVKRGHVIFPMLSPRKTLEGALSGVVVALLVILPLLLPLAWEVYSIISVGLLFGVLGQIGDLMESWVKRSADVTDSSQVLPGQGGLLDSFDSFIFTAPAFFLYVLVILER